ncbi:MAG: hypothetical protein F6K30_21880 [Cyanothece sp. SIO2G6]|nr:hypothetical protein [Cyanothece sp. SIO2G6]
MSTAIANVFKAPFHPRMLTKAWFKQLNGSRLSGMQWFMVLPLCLMGGIAVGLLVAAIALSQSGSAPRLVSGVKPEAEAPTITGSSLPAWQVATDVLPGAVTLPSEPAKRNPKAPSAYDQAMTIGYRAYREQDYQTALINFRRALEHRQGDRYATEAVKNVETIIQYQRQQKD